MHVVCSTVKATAVWGNDEIYCNSIFVQCQLENKFTFSFVHTFNGNIFSPRIIVLALNPSLTACLAVLYHMIVIMYTVHTDCMLLLADACRTAFNSQFCQQAMHAPLTGRAGLGSVCAVANGCNFCTSLTISFIAYKLPWLLSYVLIVLIIYCLSFVDQ